MSAENDAVRTGPTGIGLRPPVTYNPGVERVDAEESEVNAELAARLSSGIGRNFLAMGT